VISYSVNQSVNESITLLVSRSVSSILKKYENLKWIALVATVANFGLSHHRNSKIAEQLSAVGGTSGGMEFVNSVLCFHEQIE
jgi:hypothetical protein